MLRPQDLKGRRAISYARWSSGKQTQGDSLRRQTEAAEAFCHLYGLTLEDRLVDEGVSAFKGNNLKAELGRFEEGVRVGRIPSDIVLLVENLDRISRLPPRQAIVYLSGLLDVGVTLVTLTDNRVHTAGGYDDNFGGLLLSLVSMQAANEYAAKISERVAAAWEGRQAKAKDGARVKVSKPPFWIDRETQTLIPDRADHAGLIFKLAAEGMGQATIVRTLNERGIPSPSGNTWERSGVQHTLSNRAAYGSLVFKGGRRGFDGEEVRDFYPPIITEAEFLAIRDRVRSKVRNPQASNGTNLFPRMVYCANCGSAMNLSSRKGRDRSYRYLVCSGKAFKRTDCTAPNWDYGEFEGRIVGTLGLLAVPSGGAPIPQHDTGPLEAEIAKLDRRVVNLTDAIGDAEDVTSRKVLTESLTATNRAIEEMRGRLARLRETVARAAVATEAIADIAQDAEEIERLSREDRPRARQLLGDLIKRIALEDAGDFRLAHVSLRTGNSHTVGFE